MAEDKSGPGQYNVQQALIHSGFPSSWALPFGDSKPRTVLLFAAVRLRASASTYVDLLAPRAALSEISRNTREDLALLIRLRGGHASSFKNCDCNGHCVDCDTGKSCWSTELR